MLNHKVTIAIDDQVAVTHVEQTFRNHTDRQLEATYIFPVPKGASVNKFSMWVDGKEVKGELVEADKAREIYTDIVRRTQDPGLLEYMGNNLLQLQGLPHPAARRSEGGAQLHQRRAARTTAWSSTSTRSRPTARRPPRWKSSPSTATHQVAARASERLQPDARHHAQAHQRQGSRPSTSSKNQALLDKDFQLFYSTGDKDVGLTRPDASADQRARTATSCC